MTRGQERSSGGGIRVSGRRNAASTLLRCTDPRAEDPRAEPRAIRTPPCCGLCPPWCLAPRIDRRRCYLVVVGFGLTPPERFRLLRAL